MSAKRKTSRKRHGRENQGEQNPPFYQHRKIARNEALRKLIEAGVMQHPPVYEHLLLHTEHGSVSGREVVGTMAPNKSNVALMQMLRGTFSGPSGSSTTSDSSQSQSDPNTRSTYYEPETGRALGPKSKKKGGQAMVTSHDLQLLEPLPFDYSTSAAYEMQLDSCGDARFLNRLGDAYSHFFNETGVRIEACSVKYGFAQVNSSRTVLNLSVSNDNEGTSIFPGMGSIFTKFLCSQMDESHCSVCSSWNRTQWLFNTNENTSRPMMHHIDFETSGRLDPAIQVLSNYRVVLRLAVSNPYGDLLQAPLALWPEAPDSDKVHVFTAIAPMSTTDFFPVYVNTYHRDMLGYKVMTNDLLDAVVTATELLPFTWSCHGCYRTVTDGSYDGSPRDVFRIVHERRCARCLKEEFDTGMDLSSGIIPNIS